MSLVTGSYTLVFCFGLVFQAALCLPRQGLEGPVIVFIGPADIGRENRPAFRHPQGGHIWTKVHLFFSTRNIPSSKSCRSPYISLSYVQNLPQLLSTPQRCPKSAEPAEVVFPFAGLQDLTQVSVGFPEHSHVPGLVRGFPSQRGFFFLLQQRGFFFLLLFLLEEKEEARRTQPSCAHWESDYPTACYSSLLLAEGTSKAHKVYFDFAWCLSCFGSLQGPNKQPPAVAAQTPFGLEPLSSWMCCRKGSS